jgi:hypothetical protein
MSKYTFLYKFQSIFFIQLIFVGLLSLISNHSVLTDTKIFLSIIDTIEIFISESVNYYDMPSNNDVIKVKYVCMCICLYVCIYNHIRISKSL